MIVIEVLSFSDKDYLGIFEFSKNEIYFGQTRGDIIINFQSFYNDILKIEIIENKLLISPNERLDFYLTNGKRTTHPKFIKIGTTIDLNGFVFRVNHFETTAYKTPREVLNDKTEILIQENHKILGLIKAIKDKD